MRLNIYINEEAEEKDPAQDDIKKIVDTVKMATDPNQMNNAVKQAAAMSKIHGSEWVSQLKKSLSVDIVPDTVGRFVKYVEEFAEKLTHIKE